MFLAETSEQQALRKELRAYFERMMTDAVRAELGGVGEGSPLFRDLVRQMGRTVGSASAGRSSTEGRDGPRPTSSSSSTRCSGRRRRSRS